MEYGIVGEPFYQSDSSAFSIIGFSSIHFRRRFIGLCSLQKQQSYGVPLETHVIPVPAKISDEETVPEYRGT